jgi:predicted  nucleic acid-binding Zn-ribbon protein
MPKVYSNLKINSLKQTPRKSAMAIDLEGYVVKGDVYDFRKDPTLSSLDKDVQLLDTSGDESQASATRAISEAPLDNSYIDVKINGISYEVGNGVKTKSCYFSNDGGVTAKGFSSSYVNGKVEVGDFLYWNGNVAGFDLKSTWKASIHYLRNEYNQIEVQQQECQANIADLQTSLDEINSSIDNLQAEYDKAIAAGEQALADKILAELTETQDKKSATEADIKTSVDTCQEISDLLTFGVDYYALLNQALALKSQKEAEIQSLNDAEAEAVELYSQSIAALQQQISDNINQIDSLNAQMSQLQNTIQQLESERAEAEAIGDQATSNNLALQINDLQTQLAQANQTLNELQVEIAEADAQLNQIQAERAAENDEYQQNLAELQSELDIINAQVAEYQSYID